MTTHFKDLTGRRFGRLLVLNISNKTSGSPYYWNCICDCGNTKEVRSTALQRGDTISCGCFRSEASSRRAIETNTTHGMSNHELYGVWKDMMARCYNPNVEKYKDYGGRGIVVCERWQSVENFIADIGARPEKMSIDREDVNGNYEPGNVRWATDKQQQNNKRNNVIVAYEGQQMNVTEVAEKTGIPRATIFGRINRGKTGNDLFKKK